MQLSAISFQPSARISEWSAWNPKSLAAADGIWGTQLTEDEADLSKLATLFLLMGIASAAASGVLQVILIAGINKNLGPRSEFRYLRRDVWGIVQEHRRLFPESKLRAYFIASLVLFSISAVGIVVFGRIR